MDAPFRPRRSYLVFGRPRTGSMLLCGTLAATKGAGDPRQYITRGEAWVRHSWLRGRADHGLQAHPLAHLARRVATPDGVFATKLFWHERAVLRAALHDHPRVRDKDPALLRYLFWEPRIVHLSRRDELAQAISWVRADQTGAWTSQQEATGEPAYDRKALAAMLHRIRREGRDIGRFLRRVNLPVLHVDYEELVADRDVTLRRVLAFLEVPDADRVPLPEPSLRRQADGLNAAWRARFERESGPFGFLRGRG